MLEDGEVLLTWQLAACPGKASRFPIPAQRIHDHRRVYLDYEGPISGNRGTVTRVESGTFEFVERAPERTVLDLAGNSLRGRYVIRGSGPAGELVRGQDS